MPGQIAPVPEGLDGAVETVLGFVNTRFDGKGGRTERFGNAEDFVGWARERGLMGEEAVGESDVAAARELRSALLTVMLEHAGHPDRTERRLAEAERHLDRAGSLYPVRVTLSAAGSKVGGQDRGVAGVLGTVLASANEIVQHGAWWRVKACCSQPCEHGLFDRTKNGAQRYCTSKCASRAAMRAMRERQRVEKA